MEPLNANAAILNQRPKLLILFLALLAATPPLTTDMYLVAIPRIAEGWGVAASRVNLSLVLWFIAFSVGLLFWGVFSDRIGRRKVMSAGTLLFFITSLLCAFSRSVEQLILFRIVQGVSAAAPSAMSLAVCRDCYQGRARQKALAWIGIILLLAPMLAPLIGAVIVDLASWRQVFVVQAFLGMLMLLLALFFYRETITERESGNIGALLKGYGRLMRNGNYLLAVLTMALAIAPGFAFIGFSTIVYLNLFEVGDKVFALLFGANAFSLMLGAMFCTRLLGYYRDSTLIAIALGGGAFFGALVLLLGHFGYGIFAVLMALYSFCFGMTRPLANNLILDQVERDIGTASSLIIFIQFVLGACAMAFVTADWSHPMLVFGLLVSVVSACMFVLWLRIYPRFYAKRRTKLQTI